MRFFSLKTVAFSVITLAVSVTAHADDIVFDNVFSAPSDGTTFGTSIGTAINTGNLPLLLVDVLFPQLNNAVTPDHPLTDTYVAGETFSVYARTSDGLLSTALVGTTLNLQHQFAGQPGFGQTDAIFDTPLLLDANSSYFLVVNSNSVLQTGWEFSNSPAYTFADGVTRPTNNTAFEANGPTSGAGNTAYFTSGYQLANVNANVAVPETGSSLGLLALGAGALMAVRRMLRSATGSIITDLAV